jgi:hypothetical protein
MDCPAVTFQPHKKFDNRAHHPDLDRKMLCDACRRQDDIDELRAGKEIRHH